MTRYTRICDSDEVPAGEARMFVADDRRLAVFHLDGEFRVIDDACPHAGASLALGALEGHIVSCRIHHWRFCLKNGRYLDQDLPRYDVATYPARVVDGVVEAALDGLKGSGLIDVPFEP